MSTYGDRGNIVVLRKRLEWRGVRVAVLPIEFQTTEKELNACDLIFGGGAQDRQQGIVIGDLRKNKGPVLKELFGKGIPGLFVCGAPQLLGHYYMTGDGKKLEGLGIFDMVSKHFGKEKQRCIGILIAELRTENSMTKEFQRKTIVGFENHGGRTYLHSELKSQNSNLKANPKADTQTLPFAWVIKGFGNNGEDGTEGAVYKNCIATYSHGPFLPKNPHIADWLIAKALEVKYKKEIKLSLLDDALEWTAHDAILAQET